MLFLFYGRDLVKDLDKRSQKRNTNKYSLNPSKDNYQHLDRFFSKSTPMVPQHLPAPRLLAPGTFLGLGSVLPTDSAMGCTPQSMPTCPLQGPQKTSVCPVAARLGSHHVSNTGEVCPAAASASSPLLIFLTSSTAEKGLVAVPTGPHFVPHPCTALQQVGIRERQSLPSCAVRPGVWLPKLTGSSRSTHVPGEKAWSSQGESRKKKEQGARGASRPLAPKDLAETVRYNRRWTKR